jgi:hypothetical protein
MAPVGTRLYRISRARYPDPAYFGRQAIFRFDAPDRSYGVCYLGTTLDAAFLEAVPLALAPQTGERLVAAAELATRHAARATVVRPLRLAFFADDGLALNGVDLRVTGGDDYQLSQGWSAAIHRDHPSADGIFYASRHHNGLYCVALLERSRDAVQFDPRPWGTLASSSPPDLASVMARIILRFAVRVVP